MSPKKKFIKNVENFTCSKCGHKMIGNGFTNHCSKCLWSMHVDVNPGDRLSDCKMLMKPIGAVCYGDEYVIVHKCTGCGHQKRNKTAPDDSIDVIIKLSAHPIKE